LGGPRIVAAAGGPRFVAAAVLERAAAVPERFIFKGALTEQYVLEELTALSIKPFYWSPDNAKAEIEFLIQGEREVYPLEAKAEINLKSASLKSYFERYAPTFEIRVSMHKRSSGARIEDIPLYGIPAILPLLKGGK
jgi:predicted AAA+ superfamily ATPase